MNRIIAAATPPPAAVPVDIKNLLDQVGGRSESRSSSFSSLQSDEGDAATLWCPKQKRNHGSLIEWRVFICPFCHQNLTPPDTNASSQSPVIPKTGTGFHTGQPAAKGSDAIAPGATGSDVRYFNHYLLQDDLLAVDPWDGLLDLQKERGNLTSFNNSALEIITEIQVTYSSSAFRRSGMTANPRKMLDNPEYRMEIRKRFIRVVSRQVIEALTRMVTYYPGVSLVGDQIKIEEPYCIIFHHMERIEEYQSTYSNINGRSLTNVDDSCDEVTHHHLDVLKSTVMEFYGEDVQQEKARHRQSVPRATFKMLWLLYKPGTTVYTELDGGMQACVIKSVRFSHKSTSELKTPYCLNMWYMNFDGHRLGRCECTRYISPFEGERDITSLRVYPCEFLDIKDDGLTRKKLEARGKRFYRYLRGAQVEYHGDSLGNPPRRVRILLPKYSLQKR